MRNAHRLLIVLGAAAGVLPAAAQTSGPAPGQSSRIGSAAVTPQDAGSPARASDDTEFLVTALRTGLAEIEMGTLAEQRAASPAVREYGKKLAADHTNAVTQIRAMLASTNVTVPSAPSVEAQSHHTALAKLSGSEFDAAFLPLMVASHEEAVEAYGAQTHANPNKELAAFASQALPMLREHLVKARALEGSPSVAEPKL